MKISGEEAFRSYSQAVSNRGLSAIAEPEVSNNGVGVSGVVSIDKLNISSQARDIQLVKNSLAQLPDVREDRVAALKAQYESGTYQVSGEDIADLIIRRALADSTNI
ncbi:MAG: flagellar biosynthesis anti-sigma factor FlgM [Chthonomonadaceae bacterium]|nr:flagellar biosynthesis anti-sigma factor FlgM [Chthonomonadaceae bacterium]